MEVLNPVAVRTTGPDVPGAGRFVSLDAKMLGLLRLNFPNADVFLDALTSMLERDFRIGGVVREAKTVHTRGAPASLLEELARRVDVVLYGYAY